MNKKKRYILIALLLLSVINIVIFFFRDQFSYHKMGSYSSLYESNPEKWKQLICDYPANELQQAKTILDSSINMKEKTAVEKVTAIGRLLYNHFNKQSGKPSDALLSASPLQQYRMLSSLDSEKVWCGVYASMFAFFCWSEGIPCRIIEIMNPGDHHVLNECYFPDGKQWAIVDLTFNRLLIMDSLNNRFINFFDVLKHSKSKLFNIQTLNDSIISTAFVPSSYDYYLNNDPLICYYYRVNNFKVYRTGEKLKRYFLPVSWYEEVNRNNSNFLFYIKELIILLWLICCVLFLTQSTKWK